MTDQHARTHDSADPGPDPFDVFLQTQARDTGGGRAPDFTTVFRGYDRDEVDAAIAKLNARVRSADDELALLKDRHREVSDAADAHAREAEARVRDEVAAEQAEQRDTLERLQAELTTANARASKAEQRVQALTEELVEGGGPGDRPRFEEILRVAEDQASLIIRNASVQADRLLEAARDEIGTRRKEAEVEAQQVRSHAQHDAQQARLKIETEVTAHQSRLERDAAHAAEKIAQAEREATAIRTEADRGAAALRSLVTRETTQSRAEAEEAVRDLRVRALDFEESLTRRQDDAQQEFLVLHNQAVAHAERITHDANDQVAASLDHAQRVAAKAEDFDRLMRAQAQQIEADAQLRAREHLDRAHVKAQRIIDTVSTHSQAVLRDAEDRTRQLRWQQHQLTSFMAEIKELIRPEASLAMDAAPAGSATGSDDPAEPSFGHGSSTDDDAADAVHTEERVDDDVVVEDESRTA